MSDAAPAAPAVSPSAVSSVHQAIRRGSVLKSVPKPVVESAGLPQATVTAYTQRVEAGKNEQSVLKELAAKRGSISLKATSGPREDKSAKAAAAAYLAEQEAEADILTQNSKILHALREQDEEAPPPPPPAEEDDASSAGSPIPPPPSTAAPADFLAQITPKAKLGLQPVHQQKLSGGDGINPNLLALSQIEKKDLKSTLKPASTKIKDHFLSEEYKEEARQEEAELNKALRRNSVLMDQFRLSGPPPSYPESAEDLKEAQEAKEAEELALKKLEVIDEHAAQAATPAPASSGAALAASDPNRPRVELARRNSKLAYLGDLTKPLARVALNPVSTQPEKPLKERIQEEQPEGAAGAEQKQ